MNLLSVNRPVVKAVRVLLALICLLFMAGSHQTEACDNTLLEMLTGSCPQQAFSDKLLVMSSKMQTTAVLAQAFNQAAAEKLHNEVMDIWLYVAAQITSNPPGNAGSDSGFQPLIVQISRDLGSVRQQIAARQLEGVHDRLEITVSRMSLLAAIMNGHRIMREFLEFEQLILCLRPMLQPFAASRAAVADADFNAALDRLKLPETEEVFAKKELLKKHFAAFAESVGQDEKAFSKNTLTAYLALYNDLSAMKKTLLAVSYFAIP